MTGPTYNIVLSPGHPIMPDGRPAPSVLTNSEAAEFLRCSIRSLDFMRERGQVRAIKHDGGRVLWPIEELQRYLKTAIEKRCV